MVFNLTWTFFFVEGKHHPDKKSLNELIQPSEKTWNLITIKLDVRLHSVAFKDGRKVLTMKFESSFWFFSTRNNNNMHINKPIMFLPKHLPWNVSIFLWKLLRVLEVTAWQRRQISSVCLFFSCGRINGDCSWFQLIGDINQNSAFPQLHRMLKSDYNQRSSLATGIEWSVSWARYQF